MDSAAAPSVAPYSFRDVNRQNDTRVEEKSRKIRLLQGGVERYWMV